LAAVGGGWLRPRCAQAAGPRLRVGGGAAAGAPSTVLGARV
jgi:hypothetical protein